MAILDEKITARLLEQIEGNSLQEKWMNCRSEYPWYPLPWLMTAETDIDKQKAALWFRNEHRIHWLLNGEQHLKETFAAESMATIESEDAGKDAGTENGERTETIENSPSVEANPFFTENIDNQEIEDVKAPEAEELPEPVTENAPGVQEVRENEMTNSSSEIPAVGTLPNNNEDTEKSLTDNQQEPAAVVLSAEEMDLKREVENDRITPDDDIPSLEPEAEKVNDPLPVSRENNPALPGNSVATSGPNSREEIAVDQKDSPATRENKEELLAFEPLYSIDYFASQGIRVDAKAVPQTQFDRQVRSFTQWLKTMKRIAPETPVVADPVVDAQASESVAEKEVLTEAMAEVLEKQGKFQKAIEILRKLILLHPEKSAFFAAQIEKLKAKQ